MVVINYIIAAVGLVICFGGIDLKRICYAAVGFVWGGIGTIVGMMVFGGLRLLTDRNTFLYILIGALLFALISAAYNKLCAAINGFLSTFSISFVTLSIIKPVDSSTAVLGIAAIIGLVFAVIAYKLHEFTIILITAFSGAFMTMLGIYGIIHNSSINELLSMLIFFDYQRMGTIFIGTLILGLIGVGVQYHRLNKKRERANIEETPSSDFGESVPITTDEQYSTPQEDDTIDKERYETSQFDQEYSDPNEHGSDK